MEYNVVMVNMNTLVLVTIMCVVLATTIWTASMLPVWTETTDQPMVSTELLDALQRGEFKGLPESLLADRGALVRQLEAVIAKPPVESEEVAQFIRGNAIVGLGRYGGPEAVPTLRKLAEDKTEIDRRFAVVWLERTKTKEGVAAAAKFLNDEDELIRKAAIHGLADSDREEALEVLKQFDASKDKPFIQRKRLEAIEKLTAAIRRQSEKP